MKPNRQTRPSPAAQHPVGCRIHIQKLVRLQPLPAGRRRNQTSTKTLAGDALRRRCFREKWTSRSSSSPAAPPRRCRLSSPRYPLPPPTPSYLTLPLLTPHPQIPDPPPRSGCPQGAAPGREPPLALLRSGPPRGQRPQGPHRGERSHFYFSSAC